MKIKTFFSRYSADKVCPLSIYLGLREQYPGAFLLESSEYKQAKNGSSFIGFDPIIEITLVGMSLTIRAEGLDEIILRLESRKEAVPLLSQYLSEISPTVEQLGGAPSGTKPRVGLFGYLSYDAVTYFDSIELSSKLEEERSIPALKYSLFRYILQLNHVDSEMLICQNMIEGTGAFDSKPTAGEFDSMFERLSNERGTPGTFSSIGEEESNFSDDEYGEVVEHCKKHISRGDVFQVVPSRRFSQSYAGDDFQVYKALREINPSPYLFYFDCGDFRLFGSSPEALVVIEDGLASSFPIAGTRFRSGNDEDDRKSAADLLADEKENAEHVMLVDLARNDLSRFCTDVQVKSFRETQFYSHVIHLVSLVQGRLDKEAGPLELLAAVFPAGTLSGAPKYRAMQIIDELERGHRANYAGGVGFIDFSGNINHAIMIRTFLSKDGTLYCQAGGGIVADSKKEDEVQEVKNKLAALKRAVVIADQSHKEESRK